jgi:hypothetical protein
MMEGGRQARDEKKPACAAEYRDEFFTSYEYLMRTGTGTGCRNGIDQDWMKDERSAIMARRGNYTE